MKFIKWLVLGAAVAALSGCAVYAPAPAPGYYYGGPPVYYGPSVGIGVYGGYHRHWR